MLIDEWCYSHSGKNGELGSSFLGNVCIWKEIMEFGGNLYLLVHKKTKIVQKFTYLPGRKHFFQP